MLAEKLVDRLVVEMDKSDNASGQFFIRPVE